jgi:hypothetical protein
MKRKATFLLIIFMLNTLVGFSCALHFDQHIHGRNHSLEKSASYHRYVNSHNHHRVYQMAHDVGQAGGAGFVKENLCCKTLTGNLAIQGKLNADNNKALMKAPVVLWFRSGFNPTSLVAVVNNLKISHARFIDQPLPDKDIRISIRSFQI